MASKRQLFLQHVAQTSEFPIMLEIEKAEGIYLYDKTGKSYIDIISGIGVSSLGHRHPRVVDAVKQQMDEYLHTMVYGEFVMSPQVQLATLISNNTPDGLDSVYFVNSGSEAVEGAMKLAKKVTGRTEIIAAKNAYHGSTHAASALMSDTFFTKAYFPLVPGIRFIEYNNQVDLKNITSKTACVIIETIQGEAGVQIPKNDYFKKLRARCTEVGALLILDEIQCGYGRTGSLFAFEQFGIVPDVLLIAKAMGGGMPIGAFVASKEMMDTLAVDPVLGHITTFGGHPVMCAAGVATLEVLLESDWIAEVKKKEQLFKDILIHPAIKEIRSAGLMMAVELKDFDFVQKVIERCVENGLMIDWFLFNDKSIRIAPPLVITEEEVVKSAKIILDAIEGAWSAKNFHP